ncbi:sensor histidine kinase [Amycolatopsis pigmentata]|uniref:histidine kinase n=1 Tax=Amycolatopsis pigmentata TaxID=450801 RepID=A0ABW5FLY4_9PSEU
MTADQYYDRYGSADPPERSVTMSDIAQRAFELGARDFEDGLHADAERWLRTAVEYGFEEARPLWEHCASHLDAEDKEAGAEYDRYLTAHGDEGRKRVGYRDLVLVLSHRDRTLVRRQFQLIDRLEGALSEVDKVATLLQLDRIANRIRRNAENLMVLSGGRPARKQVDTAEIIRTAIADVDQHERIVLNKEPYCRIDGHVAGDLTRLLTELLDNATAFSDPSTAVVMDLIEADRGALRIEITDHGPGMSGAQIAEANSRLAGGTADPLMPEQLGLAVAGRLARRHGLHVTLESGMGLPGVKASVLVPGEVRTEMSVAIRLPDSPARQVLPRRPDKGTSRREGYIGSLSPAPPPAEEIAYPSVEPDPEPTWTRSGARWSPPEHEWTPTGAAWASPESEWTPPDRAAVEPEPAWDGTTEEEPEPEPAWGRVEIAEPEPEPAWGRVEVAQPEPEPVWAPPEPAWAPPQPAAAPPRRDYGAGDPLAGGRAGTVVQETTPIFDAIIPAWFREDSATAGSSTGTTGTGGWDFAADASWRAVQEVSQAAPETFTEVGLPRRRRGEQLMPGSLAPPRGSFPAPPPPEVPTRDANEMRGRLSNFQRGLNRGRYASREQPPVPDVADTSPGMEFPRPPEPAWSFPVEDGQDAYADETEFHDLDVEGRRLEPPPPPPPPSADRLPARGETTARGLERFRQEVRRGRHRAGPTD